jgi:prefoldin subunit 5
VSQALEAEGTSEMRTLVDLGSSVFCAARVPDSRRLFVNIGCALA